MEDKGYVKDEPAVLARTSEQMKVKLTEYRRPKGSTSDEVKAKNFVL